MSDPTLALRPRLLEIARNLSVERGWTWLEPVDIKRSSSGAAGRIWTIRTNADEVGMNIRILIRESDGAILQASYLLR
jgi:hypothetical protein